MTQILEARKGNITPEMEAVARAEGEDGSRPEGPD